MTITAGQERLREIVMAFGAHSPEASSAEDLAPLRQALLTDPVIARDPRIGRELTAYDTRATYANLQAARFPVTDAVDAYDLDVAMYVYDRPDGRDDDRLPARSGGIKWHRTMWALLTYAIGRAQPVGDVQLTVLRGSRISLDAGAKHRALAAFLWGGTLYAAGARIQLIDDEPNPALAAACEHLDARSRSLGGFRLPPAISDKEVRALANRVAGLPPGYLSWEQLDDLLR